MPLALVDEKPWRLWVFGQAKCVEPTDAMIPADNPAAVAWTNWLQEGSDLFKTYIDLPGSFYIYNIYIYTVYQYIIYLYKYICISFDMWYMMPSLLNCITTLHVLSWNWFYVYEIVSWSFMKILWGQTLSTPRSIGRSIGVALAPPAQPLAPHHHGRACQEL